MDAAATAAGVFRPAARAAGGSENARRWIVRLTFAAIAFLILEGALRKWAFPGAGRWLFFVRDPFILAAYAVALVSGWWPARSALLATGVVFAAFGLLLAGLQLMSSGGMSGQQFLLAAYGWRNYFLTLPLLFLIGATFESADLHRAARFVLFVSIPVAVLVFLQFFSPGTAKINVGISDDIALQFRGLGLTATRIRPAGPFTSDLGLREFVVSTFAFALAYWLTPPARRAVPRWLLAAATAALLVCLGLSGSRGAVLSAGVVVLAGVACAVVARSGGTVVRALVIPTVLTVGAIVLYPLLLPEGHEAFSGRWAAAANVERQGFEFGVIGRAFYGMYEFVKNLGTTPLLGYGLGMAGNARTLLGVEVDWQAHSEVDWSRHIVDLGPLFGTLYIVLRIALTAWLTVQALRSLRTRNEPLALLLLSFAGLELLQGQITGQGAVNGFTWIYCGFVLAASRLGGAASASPRAIAAAGPRYPNLLR